MAAEVNISTSGTARWARVRSARSVKASSMASWTSRRARQALRDGGAVSLAVSKHYPSEMSTTVGSAARALGVSPAQVRTMIRRGEIQARQEAGRYVIDPTDLSTVSRRSPVRPMGQRMLAALLNALDGRPVDDQELDPVVRHRLRRHLDELRSANDPAALLAAWSAARYRRLVRAPAPASDVARAAVDPRVRLGGVSDPRSRIVVAPGELHGWLFADEPERFLRDHYLVEGPGATIVLTVTGGPAPDGPVPASWVMCDLARVPGVRERGRAAEMVREALSGG